MLRSPPLASPLVLVMGLLLTTDALAQGVPSPEARSAHPAANTRAACARLAHVQPGLKATWQSDVPTLIRGLSLKVEGDTPRARAEAFVEGWPEVFGRRALAFERAQVSTRRALIRFTPTLNGLPVVDQTVIITVVGDEIRQISQPTIPTTLSPTRVTEAEATATAVAHVLGEGATPPASLKVKRVVFTAGQIAAEGFLIILARAPGEVFEVRVEGATGRVLSARNTVLR